MMMMLTEAAVVEAVEEAGGPLGCGGGRAADGDAGHRRRPGLLARLGRIHVVDVELAGFLRSLRSHSHD